MKLIYISHWRFPSEKTMSPLIMRTCSELAGSGFEVELWIPKRQNKEFEKVDPYKYHNVEHNFLIRKFPVIDLIGNNSSLSFFIMVATFNISIFFYALMSFTFRKSILYGHDLRDIELLCLLSKNTFIEIHDFNMSRFSILNRMAIKRIKGLIVTNEIKIANLKKDFNLKENQFLHQPNAVDLKMFDINISQEKAREMLKLPKDEKIVLYTGHLFFWKGVDTLLESAKFLPSSVKIYFVGGTDEDVKSFKEKQKKNNIENVIIAGRKEHKEIPLWLKSADVLILPNTAKEDISKYETSPVKIFEYMASNVPIIASDLPSIRNIVNEKMVWFFEPDNEKSLSEKIIQALNSKEENSIRTQNAYQEVKKYSWEIRTKNIVNFIEKLENE
ncbi:MAG: glycosyltransferase [Candidatus Pacebacteria bacterium]|nr:glycosyltransferase [Candidatus Paceibacterota bacterium]